MRRWLLLAALAPVVFSACGESSSPEVAGTSEPTRATVGSDTKSTLEPTIAGATTTPEAAVCPDPYPGGAPFELTPGEQVRLQPTGSGPPVDQFQPTAFTADDDLEEVVSDSIGREEEHFSVVIKRLDDGGGVTLDPGRVFYPASLFKIWVMLEVFHQRDAGLLDFDERYVVSPYYEGLRLNDRELAPCSEVSVGDALYAMMASSDNVAANMLYDRVGYSNVDETLRQIGVGYSGLLTAGELQTTAAGMATMLEAIGAGEAISPAASGEMVAALESNVIDDRIPALLPAGTRVAHKTGNWSNVTHDVGIVFSPAATYIIAVLTDYGYDDEGAERIARLSRAVYDYYNP